MPYKQGWETLAFNYAKNNMSDHDNKKKAFDEKVKEILDS